MSVPQKILLFFIVDVMSRSLYVDGGVVKKSSPPVPLPQHPRGWQEMQISFGTNQKYWNLSRSYTIPMFFVGDGATIVRDAVYSGKGYEEELYILIVKLNPETGVYDLEYKGRLDFSKYNDEPRKGISVNAIEGGILSYLDANDGVDYPIPLDATNPDAIQVYFDGTNLFDRYKYSVVNLKVDKSADFDNHTEVYALPFPFISNEGDSVGIIQGSQRFEVAVNSGTFTYALVTSWLATSANYAFSSIRPVTITILGKVKFDITPAAGGTNVHIFFAKNDGTRFDVLALTSFNSGVESVDLDINLTISLLAEEKLFFLGLAATGSNTSSITWKSSDVYISFFSKNDPSTAVAIEPLPLLKQLVSKMTDGKYTADSLFFAAHKNIVKTSTNALRQLKDIDGNPSGRELVQSFQDFYTDYDCEYNLAMKVIGNVLWVEPKTEIYKDNVEILDLGEIANLKVRYAEDLLCNTATFGYKSQDYRQRNGKYEFNTTSLFKLPVNTLKKDYTKICKSRGDCFGIEFIRALIFDKPTTDTTGDNQVFMVNVKPGNNIYNTFGAFFLAAGNFITFGTDVPVIAGQKIRVTGSALNNRDFTIVSVVPFGFFLKAIVAEAIIEESINLNYTIELLTLKIYDLNRAAYSSITGVLDNSVYNIEEMTPHRQLLAHGPYLRSLLVQMPADKIDFQKADKNSDLVTILSGTTIAEKQSEVVSGLGDIIFQPFYLEFTTPVPLSFSKIFSNVGKGYVTFTFVGVRLYALPIGKMDGKSALNAAQTWQLISAPMNSLQTLKQLSDEGTLTSDIMGNTIFTSILNPLHFVKYDYTLPAKYHHKDIYDDQFQNRGNTYVAPGEFLQKWQKDKKIPIQCITKGLTIVDVEVYDSEGNIYFTSPMTVVANPAVNLPYVLSNYEINVSAYPEGIYFVVLSCAGNKLRISEYIDLRDDQPGTLLFEYSHSTNKFNQYFADLPLSIRVDARLLDWYDDSTFENYTNELADNEVLDGIPLMKRLMQTDFIPDWLRTKLNYILLLNRCYIEGTRYSRTPDSKVEKKEIPGSNLKSYKIEISKAVNSHGLSTDEAGSEDNLVAVYTLNAQSFGGGDGNIINIEVKNE